MLSNEYKIGAAYSADAGFLILNKHVKMMFSRCIY